MHDRQYVNETSTKTTLRFFNTLSIDKNDNEYLYENAIIANPVAEYAKYVMRLQEEGDNASFPEFKATVDYLQKKLSSAKIAAIIKGNSALKIQHDLAKTYLFHVGLNFMVDASDYPYPVPFKPYPYRPTIEAIQKRLITNDCLNIHFHVME